MTPVQDILARIQGESEDARFAAWMDLYTSDEPSAQEALQNILKDENPVLKILFARFLSYVYEERAVNYLREIFFDDNLVVIDAAKKAFEKNLYENKLPKLISVLQAKLPPARFYAMERLSLGSVTEALGPLLNLLQKADGEELSRIIMALRYLPDKDILEPLKPYLKHEEEDIRFKTVLAYGSLYEDGDGRVRKFLLIMLRDGSARIRQAALWALRRRALRRDLPYFFDFVSHDPEPLVRQECLLAFAAFPTKAVIREILRVIVADKSRMVVLKGEAVLLTMPTQKLIRGLKESLRDKNHGISTKAILLFAEFENKSKSYYRYLVRTLQKTKSTRDKLPYLEALGILKQRAALPILEKYMTADPLLRYAAMFAILKIWGRSTDFPTLTYLKNPDFSDVMKQMVLKHFLKIQAAQKNSEASVDLMSHFLTLLKNRNLNLRYLAAQALAQVPRDEIAEPLFDVLLQENDPSAVALLCESLGMLLMRNPDLFFTLFERYQKSLSAMTVLLDCLDAATFSTVQVPHFFMRLARILPIFLSLDPRGESGLLAQIFQNLFYFMLQRQLTLELVLQRLQEPLIREIFFKALTQFMHENPHFKLLVSTPLLLTEIKKSGGDARGNLVEILARSEEREAIPALVTLLCDADFQDCHELARNGLKREIRIS